MKKRKKERVQRFKYIFRQLLGITFHEDTMKKQRKRKKKKKEKRGGGDGGGGGA